MLAVVMFVMLFLGLWTIAAQQIGSMLRVEKARAARVKRDFDVFPARVVLGRALIALQEVNPAVVVSASSIGYPFQCRYDWTDDRPDQGGATHYIVVTFRLQAINPGGPSGFSQWSVEAVETETPPALPALNPSLFTPQ